MSAAVFLEGPSSIALQTTSMHEKNAKCKNYFLQENSGKDDDVCVAKIQALNKVLKLEDFFFPFFTIYDSLFLFVK